MFEHLENLLHDFNQCQDAYDDSHYDDSDGAENIADLTATTHSYSVQDLISSSVSGAGDDDDDDDDSSSSFGGDDYGGTHAQKNKPTKVFLSASMRSFLKQNEGSDFQKLDLFQASAVSDGLVMEVQASHPSRAGSPDEQTADAAQNPNEVLKSILERMGTEGRVQSYKDLREEGLVIRVTKEMINSYEATLVRAARQGNVDVVRKLHEEGYNLQCCNQFGESIVHVVARRGHYDVLSYLVHQAGISLRVCCDSGRTLLHEACWTASPNFDCIKLLIQKTPEYLLVEDNRGFTPLSYAPKSSWPVWSEFLEQNEDRLRVVAAVSESIKTDYMHFL